MSTPIIIETETTKELTTLEAFLHDNELEPEERREVRSTLAAAGIYHGGGGAAPAYQLYAAPEPRHHTPGPWEVQEVQCDDYRINVGIPGLDIACAFTMDATEETEIEKANARLIAAAPELLKQLKAVLTRLDLEAQDRGNGTVFLCNAMRPDIRAAIAKATGESE